jgi:hypothetical protein
MREADTGEAVHPTPLVDPAPRVRPSSLNFNFTRVPRRLRA